MTIGARAARDSKHKGAFQIQLAARQQSKVKEPLHNAFLDACEMGKCAWSPSFLNPHGHVGAGDEADEIRSL